MLGLLWAASVDERLLFLVAHLHCLVLYDNIVFVFLANKYSLSLSLSLQAQQLGRADWKATAQRGLPRSVFRDHVQIFRLGLNVSCFRIF